MPREFKDGASLQEKKEVEPKPVTFYVAVDMDLPSISEEEFRDLESKDPDEGGYWMKVTMQNEEDKREFLILSGKLFFLEEYAEIGSITTDEWVTIEQLKKRLRELRNKVGTKK